MRKPVLQNTYSCDPERRGRISLGQPAGIGLDKFEAAIGERGFY